MHLGGEGGAEPQKRGVEAQFLCSAIRGACILTPMFICKCFCQEAVSSRTTTENPNTFPISLCDWNLVVVYIIPMAKCLLNFPFFNDLFLVIKNLLLSEWWWIKPLSMGFSPPKPFPWIANEQSAFTSAQMEIRNERYSVWYLTKIY